MKTKTKNFLKETERFLRLCLDLSDLTNDVPQKGSQPLDMVDGYVFELSEKDLAK